MTAPETPRDDDECMELHHYPRRRSDGKIVEESFFVRLLSMRDLQLARLNAQQSLVRMTGDVKLDDERMAEMLADQRTIETLFRALRDPKDKTKPWRTPAELECLPQVDIAILSRLYTEFEENSSAFDHGLTMDKMEGWIQLAAEGKTDFLTWVSAPNRRAAFALMAREIKSLRASLPASDVRAEPTDVMTRGDLDAATAEMQERLVAIEAAVGRFVLGVQPAAVTVATEPSSSDEVVVDHG